MAEPDAGWVRADVDGQRRWRGQMHGTAVALCEVGNPDDGFYYILSLGDHGSAWCQSQSLFEAQVEAKELAGALLRIAARDAPDGHLVP